MEKKKYLKPSMEVFELNMTQQLLTYSGGDAGYAPGLPGMPKDEKYLA